MTWLRRLLRLCAWGALLFGGALILGYLALLLINWRDQPPSADTQKFERFYRELPAVADADNAYLFVLGFTAARDGDPAAAGARRRVWMQQQMRRPQPDWAGDPLDDPDAFLADRSEATEALVARCRWPDTGCLLTLGNAHAALADWLQTEAWLAQRYRTLIAYRAWRELTPIDVTGPLPAWQHVLHGQQVFLAGALVRAWEGHADDARTALEADARFWLLVLENADNLLTRSLATRALARNLLWVNLAARPLAPDDAQRVLPPVWATPLSLSQCSMRRVFAGEWMFGDFLVKNRIDVPWVLDATLYETAPGWREHLLLALERPLLQAQDSSNRDAAVLGALGATLDVSCDAMATAIPMARRQEAAARHAISRLHPYNLVYNLMSTSAKAAQYDFAGYAGRVADLETLRRGLLLTLDLRRRGIAADKIAQELETHPVLDPVSGQPYRWNEVHGTVTFTGLAQDQQAWYAFPY